MYFANSSTRKSSNTEGAIHSGTNIDAFLEQWQYFTSLWHWNWQLWKPYRDLSGEWMSASLQNRERWSWSNNIHHTFSSCLFTELRNINLICDRVTINMLERYPLQEVEGFNHSNLVKGKVDRCVWRKIKHDSKEQACRLPQRMNWSLGVTGIALEMGLSDSQQACYSAILCIVN